MSKAYIKTMEKPVMKYKERYQELAEIVNNEKRVFVSDLSKRFNVSEVTIRKDLNYLEGLGLCRRFHSGAVAVDDESRIFDIPVKYKVTVASNLKQRIARKAVSLVKPKMTVMIDAGSTAQLVARYLKGKKDIRVVTNSILAGSELADESGIELFLVGGNVRPVSQALVGAIAVDTISRIHVDIAFVGAMGVSIENGFSSSTNSEAHCKIAMLKSARKSIVIADSTKIEQVSFITFAQFKEIDLFITDNEADIKTIDLYKKAGLEIITAES